MFKFDFFLKKTKWFLKTTSLIFFQNCFLLVSFNIFFPIYNLKKCINKYHLFLTHSRVCSLSVSVCGSSGKQVYKRQLRSPYYFVLFWKKRKRMKRLRKRWTLGNPQKRASCHGFRVVMAGVAGRVQDRQLAA